jgi:hypothetical protein
MHPSTHPQFTKSKSGFELSLLRGSLKYVRSSFSMALMTKLDDTKCFQNTIKDT